MCIFISVRRINQQLVIPAIFDRTLRGKCFCVFEVLFNWKHSQNFKFKFKCVRPLQYRHPSFSPLYEVLTIQNIYFLKTSSSGDDNEQDQYKVLQRLNVCYIFSESRGFKGFEYDIDMTSCDDKDKAKTETKKKTCFHQKFHQKLPKSIMTKSLRLGFFISLKFVKSWDHLYLFCMKKH